MVDRTPLDDVEFLARSPHRVTVLRTLTSGSWTRPALHEETGISQPTLGRVLGSLQDRDWVERDGHEYALTPLGALVAEEFDRLLDTVETTHRLRDVVGLLPTEQMDFDIRQLADSTIIRPETGDVFRHVRRMEKLLTTADRVRIMSDTIAPDSLSDTRDRVVNAGDDDLWIESIITADALEQALADPQLAAWVGDLVAAEHAPVYRYDGTIPLVLALVNDTALLVPTDEHGFPGALIETDNEQVRSWVESTVDEYLARATELSVENLSD